MIKFAINFIYFILIFLIAIPYIVYRSFVDRPRLKTLKWFYENLFLINQDKDA